MGFLAWIVVGLIAGWLAGQVMKGGGYGILIDIILGILGGVLGGWIFGMLGIWQGGGMIGSIIVAFVGAVILVWIPPSRTITIAFNSSIEHRNEQSLNHSLLLQVSCRGRSKDVTGRRNELSETTTRNTHSFLLGIHLS